jgi:hypothetical protein
MNRPEPAGDPPRHGAGVGLLTAKQLARHLGLNPSWVYEHAEELGAIRFGSGPKARIRFDLHRATRVLEDGLGRRAGTGEGRG